MLRHALAWALLLGIGVLNSMTAVAADRKVAEDKKKETVDEKLKRMEANNDITIVTKGHTHDGCNKPANLTFTSTTDGDVVVKLGETKYFKIDKEKYANKDKDKDAYVKDGGFFWKCGDSEEKSRIKGATYIKIVRTTEGEFDSYWVEIELKG